MSWSRFAEFLGLLSAIVLWRQAYRASLIKLARGQFKADPNATGEFAKLKQWLEKRQDRRERQWTEADHVCLLAGIGFAIAAAVIKLVVSS